MRIDSRTGKHRIGCPYCNKHKVCPHNSLMALFPNLVKCEWDYKKNLVDPKDILSNSGKKVWWLCREKKHSWKARINCRTRTGKRKPNGCPLCKGSHGEKKISRYLKQKNIIHTPQKTFDNCKYKGKLKFDIYINKYNALIEYDGKQHFKIHSYFGGAKGFEILKIKDNIKNNYCKKNKISLLRISYNEYNKIDIIIKNFINKIKKEGYVMKFSNNKIYSNMIKKLII